MYGFLVYDFAVSYVRSLREECARERTYYYYPPCGVYNCGGDGIVVVEVEVKRGTGGGDVKRRPRNTRLKVLCAVRRGVMEGRGGVFALRGGKEGKCGAGQCRVLGTTTGGRASSSPHHATIDVETDARHTIS